MVLQTNAYRYQSKFFFLICLGTLLSNSLNAQFKDPAFSFSVQPTYSNRIIVFKGNYSNHAKDSINKADRGRDAIGGAFMVSFKTGKRQRMYTGLQFHNFGFTRRKEDLHFQDTIHPEIGVMNDLSQTGGAYADFNYRYMYLSLPLQFSTQIGGKKMSNTKIHFIYGASVSVLMKYDIRAVLHGFSTRGGEKVYILKDLSNNADRINANVHAGFRIENSLYGKDTWVFVQPELILPTLSANGSSQRQHLWVLGLQVGIYYQPDKDTSK